jgi:acyl carrier protein
MSPAETHSHRAPVERDDVARIVCEQLAEILELDPDAVVLTARLREDLDADDYALFDLVEAVEAELGERSIGLHVDDEDLAELVTVRDAVECVYAQIVAEQAG